MFEILLAIAGTAACQFASCLTGVSLRQAWPFFAIGMLAGLVLAVKP